VLKELVTVSILAFSAGAFYAQKAPQIVTFKPANIVTQVRDASFKKCQSNQMTARSDGTMEQLFVCPHGHKLFLIKKVVHK
jgi:hypothetical protein